MSLEITEGLAAVAGVLFDVFNDLGLAVGGGRTPRWPWALGLWLLTGITGVPLWRDYAHFFDTAPGWAVLSAGLWLMCLLVTLGVTVSRARFLSAQTPS